MFKKLTLTLAAFCAAGIFAAEKTAIAYPGYSLEADKGGLSGGAVELAHPDDAGHRPLRYRGPGGRAGIQDYTG